MTGKIVDFQVQGCAPKTTVRFKKKNVSWRSGLTGDGDRNKDRTKKGHQKLGVALMPKGGQRTVIITNRNSANHSSRAFGGFKKNDINVDSKHTRRKKIRVRTAGTH